MNIFEERNFSYFFLLPADNPRVFLNKVILNPGLISFFFSLGPGHLLFFPGQDQGCLLQKPAFRSISRAGAIYILKLFFARCPVPGITAVRACFFQQSLFIPVTPEGFGPFQKAFWLPFF